MFTLVAAACSGSGDDAADVEADPTAQSSPEPAAADAAAEPEPTAIVVDESTELTIDDGADDTTDDSTAQPSVEDAALAEMAGFFGFEDTDEATSCMTDYINAGGISVQDALVSGGSLTAALNCGADPTIVFGTTDDVDTVGTDLTEDDVKCAFEAMIAVLRDVPMADAGDLFSNSGPPVIIRDTIVDTCGISAEDAQFLLS